ncbi:lactate utilization protein C [Helicobacter sp. MIT 99-5507]|uniref:LutC/YkgG family protein n=1 Tax=Helicobacter sp. MIT 99-5507 TaxID=152489 RepID=UPI000E1F8378|nr:lactate utilization protein C [Helicobacter sp. MIT 99-5507]RDU58478.1 lactate utilization protein C [Helicobacter sp. MIT 99-5507]
MNREAIISSTKMALQQNKLSTLEKQYKNLIKHSPGSILEEYKMIQSANKAILVESSDVVNDIRNILYNLGSKNIIYTPDLGIDISMLNNEFLINPYNRSVEEIRDELFNTDTSIIRAVCGIADVGVFGLASSSKHPRLASLITKNCIVILEKKNIIQSIYDGVNMLKDSGDPSNMLLIAGPSRTADIELKTVFGVHGPQQVYIILI